MTTHVFIVDSTTLKHHLEYLFAGTGAKDSVIDFNNTTATTLHSTTENMLVGMIADSSRVRKGDLVIFYLQQEPSKKIYEGKFYGIFKAVDDWSFLDNNDRDQYLKDDLQKSLTFRTLIEPYKLYAEGVTEWEALDEIKHIQSPNQMLWSLIYRKLKGNRGNTMITLYESERLCQLIRNKNNRNEISCENRLLSFDPIDQKIICINEEPRLYEGRKEKINILPRLLQKFNDGLAFESHLQSYIVKNIGKKINDSLDAAIVNESGIDWLGNEVSCGVGMQRIDVMLSLQENGQKVCMPIELKAVEASLNNTTQIQRYIDWIEQYYIPNLQSDIQPVLVAKSINDKTSSEYIAIMESFKKFNSINGKRCRPIKYVEYYRNGDDLNFDVIAY